MTRYARPSRTTPPSLGIALSLLVLAAAPLLADDDPASDVRAAERRRVDVLRRASRSVVCIFADAARRGGGSGVIIDSAGYGLTNFHVVSEMLETRRGYGGLDDGNLYPLRVLGIDPGGDVAMFKLEGRERFEAAPLGDASDLALGQWVAAIGNPFLLAEDYTPTITLGIVSGLHRYQAGEENLLEYADCIQVSTSINPGNSGGPLFDMHGRVVGINGRGSFEERGRVNVGLGYAITINQIRRFMPGLRAGLLVEHGTLGATVQAHAGELIFNAVQQLSPAEKAGIELGDVLLEAGGRPLRTANDFNNAVAVLPANWPLRLKVRREQSEFERTARLERLPVKLKAPFVPDRALAHAEIRRYIPLCRDLPVRAAVEIEIEMEMPNERVRPRLTVLLPASAAAQPAGGDDLREWQALVEPLVLPAQVDLNWNLIGADEVSGRLAVVIEKSTPMGHRLRWYFDVESGALLRATSGTVNAPDERGWAVAGDVSGCLPSRWVRDRGRHDLSVTVVQVRTREAASQPSEDGN